MTAKIGQVECQAAETHSATQCGRPQGRGGGNAGSDAEAFLKSAWTFFKNEYLVDAPAELVETFNGTGLRLPKNEDDVMRAPFVVLAKYVPSALRSTDILAGKSDVATRAKTGLLLTIFSHPKWRHARLLLEVLASNDRMKRLQKDKPDDWQYWVFFLYHRHRANCTQDVLRRQNGN